MVHTSLPLCPREVKTVRLRTMTIREYARGQGRLSRMITLFWIILGLIAAFALGLYMDCEELRFWLMIEGIPFVVIPIAISWATKCPRCKGSLMTVVDSWRYSRGGLDACPNCGVSLDEQMP
jgi:hypothetical protein